MNDLVAPVELTHIGVDLGADALGLVQELAKLAECHDLLEVQLR